MTAYTQNGTGRACTAGQVPAAPTVIEWLAIMGGRAASLWAEPGDWLVRFADTGEFLTVDNTAFPNLFTAVP